jgi:hypothetical protein
MKHIIDALRNPYLLAGAVVARLAVNLATVIWATIVLAKADALTPFAGYYWLLRIAHENVWAGGLCAVALYQMYRLIIHAKPHKYGLGYALMALFWMYVWWSIVVNPGPIWPAAFACVTTIGLVAVFAFISNPKATRHANPG